MEWERKSWTGAGSTQREMFRHQRFDVRDYTRIGVITDHEDSPTETAVNPNLSHIVKHQFKVATEIGFRRRVYRHCYLDQLRECF